MNPIQNESNKSNGKNILILKIVLLLILIFLDVKFKKIEHENLLKFFQSIPRLKYYYIDMKPFRETIEFENDARLEIYTITTCNYIIQTLDLNNINAYKIIKDNKKYKYILIMTHQISLKQKILVKY